MYKKHLQFSTLLLAFCILGCASPQADSTCPVNMAKLKIAEQQNDPNIKVEIRVEIADTNEKRRIGLMERRELPMHHGMLFIWPDRSGGRYMWMKNTYIPLDMLFIDEQKVVAIIENTTPHDETPRGTEQLVDAILEVNAGWARRNNIKLGDAVIVSDCYPSKKRN